MEMFVFSSFTFISFRIFQNNFNNNFSFSITRPVLLIRLANQSPGLSVCERFCATMILNFIWSPSFRSFIDWNCVFCYCHYHSHWWTKTSLISVVIVRFQKSNRPSELRKYRWSWLDHSTYPWLHKNTIHIYFIICKNLCSLLMLYTLCVQWAFRPISARGCG